MAKKVDFYYVKDPTERELNSSSSNQFQTSNATAATRIATKTASLGKETYAALAPTEEELVVAAPPGRSLYKSESGDYLFARMYNTSAGTSYYYRTNLNASVPEGTTDLYCFYVPNATCKVRYYATKVSSVAEGASPEIIDPYLLDACDMASGDVIEFIDPATYTPKGYGLFEGSDEQTPANRKYWGIRQDSPGDTGSRIEYAAPTTVPNDDLNLYCAFVADDNTKPVSFGTLKSMFGTYKQKSDAALEERLTNLPPGGGADMEAVNAVMDARLAEYTAERDQAVSEAVGAAKAEVLAQAPKPFDFASNPDRENYGFLSAKNLYEDNIIVDAANTDYINMALRRPSSTSNNTWGFLCVKKSDVDERVAEKSPKAFDFDANDANDGFLRKKNIAPISILDGSEDISGNDLIKVCLWRRNKTSNPQGLLMVMKSDINELIDAKLAEVRSAVEGVVLYDNAAHDEKVQQLSLDGDLTLEYDRIDVTTRAVAGRDNLKYPRIATTTFNLRDLAMASLASLTRSVTCSEVYPASIDGSDYLFSKVSMDVVKSSSSSSGFKTGFYVDDSAAVILNGDGTVDPVPTSVFWVCLEKVVGYKKMPEAV